MRRAMQRGSDACLVEVLLVDREQYHRAARHEPLQPRRICVACANQWGGIEEEAQGHTY